MKRVFRNVFIRMGLRAIRAHKPEGVKLTRHPDGELVPAEVRLVRINFKAKGREPIYVWRIVSPGPGFRARGVEVDSLHGKTSIMFPKGMLPNFPARGVSLHGDHADLIE